MSKSCCSHQHAAPIKAVSKAAASQAEHSHTSHCCDNTATASCAATPAPHDHQARGVADVPGDEEPPRGGCCTDIKHDHGHHHEQGHAHDHASAADEPPLDAPEQNSRRHSWQVLGMDCPSCARKIETAVSRVNGVQQARVLFATEKLVVDLAP
ncbi:TPA: cation transporter, partial [Aeromonas dhakensis]|nr:cation transporter [Aeromonas dhakensis]